MKLQVNREALGQFCRQRGVARLDLFGSALREDFHEDSDVDLLCYDEVNLNVVGDAAMDSLPPLISQLESYLAAHPPPESNGPPADV